ncbi:MAG: PorT family protein [Chlorobi bacterium]|nr:PorT family protein [Chlorobiota bacterium]
MKKTIVIITLVLIGLAAHSQILITLLLGDKLNSDKLEFGLEGGLNWSRISAFEASKYHGDWNLGFYFNFQLHPSWYINTGVLVKSTLGAGQLTDNDLSSLNATIFKDSDGFRVEGNYSQQMNYFLVPVLVKHKFKNNFYLELGPQFGLMYRSWIQFDSDLEGRDAIIKEYNREKLNKIDAGLTLGAGYRLFKGTGWTLGAKYYYGFVNVYKGKQGSNNSSFFLKMNIPIGAGEKAKEKAAQKAERKRQKKAARQSKKE